MSQSTRIVVCADDYAFTPGVSRGIRELLAAKRISATSVMTTAPYWPEEAAALKAVAGDADIGLHVILTDQRPLRAMPQLAPEGRFPPLKWMFRAGIARRLPLAEIESEVTRQIEAFIAHYGKPPAHIDGHHHVHQLPGIRSIVMRLAKAYSIKVPGQATWVRSCHEQMGTVLMRGTATAKSLIIGSLGSSVERLALEHGVTTNSGFTGIYDYTVDGRAFDQLCGRFLIGVRANTVMMVHPGYSDATLAALDVFTTPREAELRFLSGPQWPELLAARRLTIGPLDRAPCMARAGVET